MHAITEIGSARTWEWSLAHLLFAYRFFCSFFRAPRSWLQLFNLLFASCIRYTNPLMPPATLCSTGSGAASSCSRSCSRQCCVWGQMLLHPHGSTLRGAKHHTIGLTWPSPCLMHKPLHSAWMDCSGYNRMAALRIQYFHNNFWPSTKPIGALRPFMHWQPWQQARNSHCTLAPSIARALLPLRQ
jgi:hypothetical protein